MKFLGVCFAESNHYIININYNVFGQNNNVQQHYITCVILITTILTFEPNHIWTMINFMHIIITLK